MSTSRLALTLLFCCGLAQQASAQRWDEEIPYLGENDPGEPQPPDDDWDTIPDALEQALAERFFPNLNMYCADYEDIPGGSRGQFYGSGTGFATAGLLPFVAHLYKAPNLAPCDQAKHCIEIRYGLPYNWDLGDDSDFAMVAGKEGDHRGDSEMVSLLLQTDQDWQVAKSDPNAWSGLKMFTAAHVCTDDADSSSFHDWAGQSAPDVWAAEGKNASYDSQKSCNNGGFVFEIPASKGGSLRIVTGRVVIPPRPGVETEPADDCTDNRCWIDRDYAITRLRNAYEFGTPGNHIDITEFLGDYMGPGSEPVIPSPSESKTSEPSGDYAIWSGESFGETTSYCEHFKRELAWDSNTYQCGAIPDC